MVKVTVKGQNVNVYPDDIFYTTKHFVSKLGIMMDHHELECYAKRLVCYFQGQVHSKGSYDQNVTVFTILSELLIFFSAKLFLIVHHHKRVCFIRNWIAMLRVKVTDLKCQ